MIVGIIGLGIMGSAYAKHLIAAGVTVRGSDPQRSARERLEQMGGAAHDSTGDWLEDCDVIVTALVSPAVLRTVAAELAAILRPGQVVADTGTFALEDKFAARDTLAEAGIEMLDCTVSGTGAQAWVRDLVFMASGAGDAIAAARPVMDHVARKVIEAGEFGNASRLKYVANHAVAIHNTAAAETLNYAVRMGLDRDVVYDMLSTGAGQSKMSDLRMPLMISGSYEPPTASLKMFEKDIAVIGADIARLGVEAPLFDVVAERYARALEKLPPTHDAAAVYEVYRGRDDTA